MEEKKEEKRFENQKENTYNKFSEKHDYEEEKKAQDELHTDQSISDKNPKSRH